MKTKKKWSKNVPDRIRRKGAKVRLEEQLKKGTKNTKEQGVQPLSEKDIIRIEEELSTLNERI